MLVSTAVESAPDTRTSPPPLSPIIANRRWMPRRRGACEMCRLKKIRCDGATPCIYCRRHNQECRYIGSKRRQSSKKCVESTLVTPEKSPEESENAIPSFYDNAPNGDQLSPVTTSRPSSNSTDGVTSSDHDGVQGRASTTEMLNEYDDSMWCVEMDPEGISSLLQTTDIRSMIDFNAFTWPLLTSDTDRQFDFDIPFTTNETDGLNSAVLSLGDKHLCFNRSSRTYESPEPPGEMVRMLNLNDKASMRSFLDPVPSVNFSLKAIFSSQDRWHESTCNSKPEAIYRIFESISHVQTQPVNLSDGDRRGGYASWYWNDLALIENCKAACFDQPLGISNFLTRSCFDKYMKEARGRSPGNTVLISLIDSVMAFGFQAFLKSAQRFVSTKEKRKANYYCVMALNSCGSVLNSPDTLLKLQTILAMTAICEQFDDAVYCELLTGAANCIRSLKLENSDLMIHSNNASIEDQDLARRCLWYFYSVEVPHSIRRGVSPSLDRDWIDYSPPQASGETDWFPLQCLYATIISSAAKMLYTQSALRQSLSQREQMLDTAYKFLEEWRTRLPAPIRDIHKPDMSQVLDDQIRYITLTMFRQYHEATFIIYFPWACAQSNSRVSEEWRRRSMELCVNSAQVVLAMANQIPSLDILDSSKFLDLIAVSICMNYLDVASGNGAEKSISYLSMGCGIFGRLNLDNEVPLADVLELTRIAQQIKGR